MKFAKSLYLLFLLLVMAACTEEKIYKIGVSQCGAGQWREKVNSEMNQVTGSCFIGKIGFQKKGSTFHGFAGTPVNKGVAGVRGRSKRSTNVSQPFHKLYRFAR